MEWQPIETAPKDRMILGFWNQDGFPTYELIMWDRREEAWWDVGLFAPFEATHWMPLPEPPT